MMTTNLEPNYIQFEVSAGTPLARIFNQTIPSLEQWI